MNCALCGRVNLPVAHRLPDGVLSYCAACGALFSNRAGDAGSITAYYNGAYQVDHDSLKDRMQRKAATILARLERATPGRRLLEVGSSYGEFLVEARKRDWEVTGVEIAQEAVAYARGHYQLDVQAGSLGTVTFGQKETFDAIVLLHVIEHLPDPLATLRMIHRLLAPNGILYLATPNLASLEYRLLRSWWLWVDPRAHLCLYSPQAITSVLNRAGFRVSELFSQRGDSLGLLAGVLILPWRWYARTVRNPSDRRVTQSRDQGKKLIPRLTRPFDHYSRPIRRLADHWMLGPELVCMAMRSPWD
jgi:SAM-dependent methyltransferase